MNSARLRPTLILILGCLYLATGASAGAGEPAARSGATVPRPLVAYKSNRLHVRTDLGRDEAKALFTRLEATLRIAARYWDREPRGQIDCYVVDDLNNWRDADLPHRLARVIVHGVGGATVPRTLGAGKRARNNPTVFASSRQGIAEHELIHAYCTQTFGTGGPEWYKEGMAEMVSRGSSRGAGLCCSSAQVELLRGGKRPTLREIFQVGDTRKRLSTALKSMMDDPAHGDRHVSTVAWTQEDTSNVAQARDEYLRSWALCYMLLHNPNYATRFRTMGNLLLIAKHHGPWESCFDPVQEEMAFEYRFLLDRLVSGYRVDLCRWDWRTRFQRLEAGATHRSRVAAARGFQASGLELVAGQRYHIEATGHWSTDAEGSQIDADGQPDRSGRLIGVVMNGYALSDPFWLGTSSEFVSPLDGRLYLRCNDAWGELGDNAGRLVMRYSVLP